MKNWIRLKKSIFFIMAILVVIVVYISVEHTTTKTAQTLATPSVAYREDPAPLISKNENVNMGNVETERQHSNTGVFFYYSVTQNLGEEGVPDFFEQLRTEGFLERIKLFNDELREDFDLFGHHTQFVQYMGDFNEAVNGNTDEFVLSPVNQVIKPEDGSTFVITTLKTLMLGEESCGFLDEFVDEGRSFNSSDFSISSVNSPFKVILGHAYSEYFDVGDKITVNLYREAITLEIIGFMKNDSLITYDAKESLDHTIIMPIVNLAYVPKDEDEEMFQIFYYAMRNEGIIRVKSENGLAVRNETYYRSIDDISKQIEDIAAKYDLYYSAGGATRYPFLDHVLAEND